MSTYMDVTFSAEEVTLSLFLAIAGTYSSLECISVARRKLPTSREAKMWLFIAACALGYSTIFTMHFVGMQAVRVQYKDGSWHEVEFSLVLILLSIPPIVIAAYIAFMIMRGSTVSSMLNNKLKVVICGTILAVGVGIMHYAGLVAMCGPFEMEYSYPMVAVTVVLAVTLCTVGVILTQIFEGIKQRVICAVIIGGAVTCVHYVGMLHLRYKSQDADRCMVGQTLGSRVSAQAIGVWVTSLATLANFCTQIIQPHIEQQFVTRVVTELVNDKALRVAAGGKTDGGVSDLPITVAKDADPSRSHTVHGNLHISQESIQTTPIQKHRRKRSSTLNSFGIELSADNSKMNTASSPNNTGDRTLSRDMQNDTISTIASPSTRPHHLPPSSGLAIEIHNSDSMDEISSTLDVEPNGTFAYRSTHTPTGRRISGERQFAYLKTAVRAGRTVTNPAIFDNMIPTSPRISAAFDNVTTSSAADASSSSAPPSPRDGDSLLSSLSVAVNVSNHEQQQ